MQFIFSTISKGRNLYWYIFHSGSYLPVNKSLDSAILSVSSASLDKFLNNNS